jgi:NADP-dependent 3-hydroxy acid dehydrogenase YdfG
MTANLTGTAALVTGASSGIGAATARRLAEHGAAVALVARRRDRLEALAAQIDQAGGTAPVVEADITDRTQAEAAVQQTVERFGRLDTLVNNAGLMLLGPVVGADAQEWDRMIALNVRACSPPPAPPSHTCCGPPNRARAGSPTSSTSARSPAASPGTATASIASPSSA